MRALLAALLVVCGTAHAAETLRVGNDAPSSMAFCAMDYGLAHGQFTAHGLTLETSDWFGPAKGQTAILSGSVDILLGSGVEMAFTAKGAPELAIAVAAGPPNNIALIARANGPIKSPQDLAGRRLGITNAGGLSDWLAHALLRKEGLTPDGGGPKAVALVPGGANATLAAMLTSGALDAAVMDTTSGLAVTDKGFGRLLLNFGGTVPDFVSSAIFAHREAIAPRAAALRTFLAAFFDAQNAMLADKPGLVACAARKNQASPQVAVEAVAQISPAFSRYGRFYPAALDVLAQSFLDTGLLTTKPDMSKLYTEAFLPAP
jgi:NitT/TauT family transport system substrate-binding protein